MKRKCIITIEFQVDGQTPTDAKLTKAIESVMPAGYIGSEHIDGTDKWGIDIENTTTVLDAFCSRPPIGTTVMVSGYRPKAFRAIVTGFDECADDCMEVKDKHGLFWIVRISQCKLVKKAKT